MAVEILKFKLLNDPTKKIKAIADIIVQGWIVRSLKVVETDDGMWVGWPAYKTAKGRWIKFCTAPIYITEQVQKALVSRYEQETSEYSSFETDQESELEAELELDPF